MLASQKAEWFKSDSEYENTDRQQKCNQIIGMTENITGVY